MSIRSNTFAAARLPALMLAIVMLAGCAQRTPYQPVVHVTETDPLFGAVHVTGVSGDYTKESVFPVESERKFMSHWVDKSGGIEPDTRSWVVHFLHGNKLYNRDKAAAKYLLDVKVDKYWVASTPNGIGYETDFVYRLTSAEDGRLLHEERVTDSGVDPYSIAWGARIGGAVGQGVAAGITGSTAAIGQRPAGLSGDDVQISILKSYQIVVRRNVERFLPRMRTALAAGT